MEPVPAPPACAMALKEWATVLDAVACGEQLVLIRKGGLIEPGSGFEVRSTTFLFYPTFEHQAVNYLRAPYRPSFDEAIRRRAPEGHVRFDLFGVAVASQRATDPTIVERLSSFHIYHDSFVTQRLKWQPDQPLIIVVVRAYCLATPRVVPVAPHYAGCKSWVDLESPIGLEGAHPVLDELTFRRRLDDLLILLAA